MIESTFSRLARRTLVDRNSALDFPRSVTVELKPDVAPGLNSRKETKQ